MGEEKNGHLTQKKVGKFFSLKSLQNWLVTIHLEQNRSPHLMRQNETKHHLVQGNVALYSPPTLERDSSIIEKQNDLCAGSSDIFLDDTLPTYLCFDPPTLHHFASSSSYLENLVLVNLHFHA